MAKKVRTFMIDPAKWDDFKMVSLACDGITASESLRKLIKQYTNAKIKAYKISQSESKD